MLIQGQDDVMRDKHINTLAHILESRLKIEVSHATHHVIMIGVFMLYS